MKKIFIFYILIFLPLLAIVLAAKYAYFSAEEFAWALAIYVILYHPLISLSRLVNNNRIPRSDIWLGFIPFYNWKYFSFLFFNKN